MLAIASLSSEPFHSTQATDAHLEGLEVLDKPEAIKIII